MDIEQLTRSTFKQYRTRLPEIMIGHRELSRWTMTLSPSTVRRSCNAIRSQDNHAEPWTVFHDELLVTRSSTLEK